MSEQNSVSRLQESLKNDMVFKRKIQQKIANAFQAECQRFRSLKNSTDLTVAELDTIAINSATRFTADFMAMEINVLAHKTL